jgi:hypothetical protein
MKGFIAATIFVTIPLLSACGSSEPPAPKIAGGMDQKSICQTSGYIIRQKLGDNFKTINISCSAKSTGGNNVEISSGYKSPLGPSFRYTALGVVNGTSLRLEKIRVHGVDEDFVPFNSL